MNEKVLLKTTGICKSFGPTKALVGVDFELCCGEVHGLIGENGSGKSTLSSIVAGVQGADSGSMEFKGESYSPKNTLEANAAGVCMLLQEKGTFNGISVAADIFIGKEDRFLKGGLLQMGRMYEAARKALDRVGAGHISERAKTNTLSFEDLKLVEIAAAMENDPSILIVDETTTALSMGARQRLYAVIRKLREEGKSVIFISHDIDEVKEVCDCLTVLRDGVKIATLDKSEFTDQTIRQLMVGREVAENFYRNDQTPSKLDKVALQVSEVSAGGLDHVSMTVHYGEIVGLGGLTDCGMHELGKIMFGRVKPSAGQVALGDGTVIRSTMTATKSGIGYVSKDRDREALMTSSSIIDNVCAPSLRKLQNKLGLILKRNEKRFTNQWAETLSVKMRDSGQAVRELSGGNKQKVSIAKWLGFDADIIIFDCPTRGIDIGVKAAIYQLLMQLKEEGKAIVMISEELMEIIGMSDRVILLKDGRVSAEFSRDQELTESKLIEYMI